MGTLGGKGLIGSFPEKLNVFQLIDEILTSAMKRLIIIAMKRN